MSPTHTLLDPDSLPIALRKAKRNWISHPISHFCLLHTLVTISVYLLSLYPLWFSLSLSRKLCLFLAGEL